MTPQKICFRYDGSDEAKEALEIVKKKFNKDHYVGLHNVYYYSDVDMNIRRQDPDYTLVPPAEFIRLMKGEEWRPQWGEEVEAMRYLDIEFRKVTYGCENPIIKGDHVVFGESGNPLQCATIRPIRKSLKEQLTQVIQSNYGSPEAIAGSILSTFDVKERGVEG